MQHSHKPDRTIKAATTSSTRPRLEMAYGEARNFLDNRFIYLVISQRARGLSIGVNMNPAQDCNFRCVYCEVARDKPPTDREINVAVMSAELKVMLQRVHRDTIKELSEYHAVPEELLQLRTVNLSGDGEPTLCPRFEEVVQEVVHQRAQAQVPFFKIVLITNASGLHLPGVQNGLRWLTAQDEVWAKLDAGTPESINRINRTLVPLEKLLHNIQAFGRQRPVVIQSLFPLLEEQEPTAEEIEQYVQRLAELKAAGTMISRVQVYSAHRPTGLANCRHLSLKCLSQIAQLVHSRTGLEAEVF
jgi:wyosine [tRNA(Phe)-imidazoG37] synthetase (radical SAM superfamily)